jgi:hypothetical protein
MIDDALQHLARFFHGHACIERQFERGPAVRDLPQLRIAEFAPGPRTKLRTYATIGACEARSDPRLEFVLLADQPSHRTSSSRQ